MSLSQDIEKKLTKAFHPTSLTITDESHLHVGHAGARPQGESHFSVEIISSEFQGKTRIQRHKLVYECLQEEMSSHIHALRLKTMIPEEYKEEKVF